MNIHLLIQAREEFKERDASHDYEHGVAVAANLALILKGRLRDIDQPDLEIMMAAAMLHDVFDHKYAPPREDFEFETLAPWQEELCEHICKNISWSKEQKGENKALPARFDWMRRAVQDADWLDALGERGLERCIAYVEKIGGKVPEDVQKHICEKLLKIPEKLYFTASRQLAETKIQPLVKYLETHPSCVAYQEWLKEQKKKMAPPL